VLTSPVQRSAISPKYCPARPPGRLRGRFDRRFGHAYELFRMLARVRIRKTSVKASSSFPGLLGKMPEHPGAGSVVSSQVPCAKVGDGVPMPEFGLVGTQLHRSGMIGPTLVPLSQFTMGPATVVVPFHLVGLSGNSLMGVKDLSKLFLVVVR